MDSAIIFEMPDTPQILYFDIRGRAEPIRLLLEFVGTEYIDNQITPDDWETIRTTTPFRRMPVYTEGDIEIPEAFAIMSFLGRKHGLLGDTEEGRIRSDVATEAWRDYGNRVANTFGALSNSEIARETFLAEEQPRLLADLEAYYLIRPDKQSPFWAGESPTIGDFAAFHLIEGLAGQFPQVLRRFGALQEFHNQFASQAPIRRYLDSPRRPAALFYGPVGKIYPKN